MEPPLYTKSIIELDYLRPKKVRLLIAQPSVAVQDWKQESDLYFHVNPSLVCHWIDQVIEKARQETVDLVLK